MKFLIAAVVLLAVAMGAQSSVVQINGLGLGLGGHGIALNGLRLGGHGLGLNGLGLGVNGLNLGVNNIALSNGLGINGLGLGVNGYGLGVSSLGVAVPQVVSHGAWLGVPAAVNVASHSLGGVSVAQQAAVASPLTGHAATYVAKTRGAIHTAPLAGHINSVAAVNAAPAPGTW